jgi:Zn-dependent M32 family carboxypeptidase
LLKDRLAAISDVRGIESLLLWDQQTYMLAGGVAGRAEQVATLRHLVHELLVSGEMGRLVGSVNQPEPESEDFSLLRLARREYGRATRLPARLVEELARATALAEPAWRRARAVSDWGTLAPHLEKILAPARDCRVFRLRGSSLRRPARPLRARSKKGALGGDVRGTQDGARTHGTKDLRSPNEDRSRPLYGRFEEARQEEFGREVISAFGYD